jgi:hypothetical protein
MYDDIVSHTPVNKGKTSKAFAIPSKYWDGLPGTSGYMSIQAAFRCQDWTLLFIDHNVMITFHVMGLRQPCKREDLEPGSLVSFIFIFIFILKKKLITTSYGTIFGVTLMVLVLSTRNPRPY